MVSLARVFVLEQASAIATQLLMFCTEAGANGGHMMLNLVPMAVSHATTATPLLLD
jgi:hypothetical protein